MKPFKKLKKIVKNPKKYLDFLPQDKWSSEYAPGEKKNMKYLYIL